MTQFKHAGTYECIAKTTLNQDAKSTALVVYGNDVSFYFLLSTSCRVYDSGRLYREYVGGVSRFCKL